MYTLLKANEGSRYKLTQVKPIPERLIRVRVFDSAGFPSQKKPVALHYQSDTGLLVLDSERLKSAWRETAFFDYTDANGVVEFPLDLHPGAPYTAWVLSVAYPSDGATDISSGVELFFRIVHGHDAGQEQPEQDKDLRSACETALAIRRGDWPDQSIEARQQAAIGVLSAALAVQEDT
jgi:hypothetical protein